ncbi:hypothetical protein [Sedimentimonas flavescens]|uniref:hypothetical protein n=1 Tax=Sedimentimonas flavescens TaxID=2851012 RepID=UPI001C49CABA|nr:hypothetical protein [Sedimentimonas flavescens]MBW0156903.1 hypothetical protein [Sedimentimonas flavescens]
MTDSKIENFQSRLARIDQIHAAGGAFEADGALGRTYFDTHRKKARRAIPWRGFSLLFLAALLLKGSLLASLGEDVYGERVASLTAGNQFEKLGAWVLKVEPATRLVADVLRPLIR